MITYVTIDKKETKRENMDKKRKEKKNPNSSEQNYHPPQTEIDKEGKKNERWR